MKNLKNVLILSLFIISSNISFGWGITGHRVVAEVASHYLTDNTKQRISEILGPQSMASFANWMDEIKSDDRVRFDTLNPYHYVSIPDGMTYNDINVNPKGDVIAGIRTAIQKLKSEKTSTQDQAFFLKMLIHLVGDIHQPLHVGRAEDLGGNTISLTWFGSRANLHSVWDSKIIDSKVYSYTELTEVINHPTQEQVTKWQNSTLLDWAQENLEIRSSIYEFNADEKYWEYKYMYKHWDTVKKRLLMGGIRLAAVLNEIYG